MDRRSDRCKNGNVAGSFRPSNPSPTPSRTTGSMRFDSSTLGGPLSEPLRTQARADTWFRLEGPNHVAAQLSELSRRELELAAEGLWVSPGPALDAGVLYARSAVDKVRLLVRLARKGMPKKARRRINRRLKALGRELADARDPGTLEDVVERLRQGTREPQLRDGLMVLGGRLAERRYRRGAERRGESTLGETREALDRLRTEATEWPFAGEGFDAIAPGVERVYRRGRRALERAESRASRKRSARLMRRLRELGFTLRLLETTWPSPIAAVEHAVDRAAGRLHEAGELDRLARLLERDEELADNLPVHEMRERIERLASHFRAEALAGARRIFAEDPECARLRHGAWWRAWADEAEDPTEN